MTKMATALVVIDSIDEAVLFAVEGLSKFGKEKIRACMSPQHLPAKSCLLVQTEASVEATQLVIPIDKSIVGSQKTNERVGLANVALQAKYPHRRILIYQTVSAIKR